MPKNRTLICASVCGACILGFVFLMCIMSAPISAPPATDLPRNYGNYAREYDGFPVAHSLGQHITNECARAHHVNPLGTITTKQVEGVATCVDLIRSGRGTSN